jgi:murein hydrolase activator
MGKSILIFLVVFFLYSLNCYSQKIKDLESKKADQYKRIELKSKALKTTKEKKSVSLNKLLVIRSSIDQRKTKIVFLSNDIDDLNIKIKDISNETDELGSDIEVIKKEFQERLYKQYFYSKSYNEIMYIFSANSFNQAFNRFLYFKKYTEYRKKQIENISSKRVELEKKNKTLLESKELKESLVEKKRNETAKLEGDLNLEKETLEQLKKQENDLKDEIENLKLSAKKIESEIEQLILLEKQKKKNSKSANVLDEKLSHDFGKNKGFLPWPVNGSVISKFGEQQHPIFKGILINNNGIDISADPGTEVSSIFNGEVSKIFTIKGSNYIVILRHGNFISVYKNLDNVYVKIGDNVKTNQKIGSLYTELNNNLAVLHFEMWNELQKLNPEEWLKK